MSKGGLVLDGEALSGFWNSRPIFLQPGDALGSLHRLEGSLPGALPLLDAGHKAGKRASAPRIFSSWCNLRL